VNLQKHQQDESAVNIRISLVRVPFAADNTICIISIMNLSSKNCQLYGNSVMLSSSISALNVN